MAPLLGDKKLLGDTKRTVLGDNGGCSGGWPLGQWGTDTDHGIPSPEIRSHLADHEAFVQRP